jgi:hypothetical protein
MASNAHLIADPPSLSAPLIAADNACYYLKQGEVIPKEHRRIVHDSDPIDSFTAVWGDNQNFGLSYDVTTVTKAGLTLETETIQGRKSLTEPFEGALFQVYKGETLFSLVKTVGVNGEEVDTWTNTVMGEDGTPDAQQNTCCHAETTKNPATGETYSEVDYVLSRGIATSRCDEGASDGVYQVKIRPFPTYSLEEVQNPLEPLTLWAALGGALATLDLAAGFLVQNVFGRFSGAGGEGQGVVAGGGGGGGGAGGAGEQVELMDLRKAETPL